MEHRSLSALERTFLEAARRAVLATVGADGQARLVPVCYALEPSGGPGPGTVLWTPLDEKPKAGADPLALARVRDVLARPGVTILVDRWSEDWTQLAWLRLRGSASIAGPHHPDHGRMVGLLRGRYPQYAAHRLETRPMIRIEVEAVTTWGKLGPPEG